MGDKTQNKNRLTREFSSGGVVYKQNGDKTTWLVRKTSPSTLFPETYWMLPKGWIDDDGPDIPGPIASGKKKAEKKDLEGAAVREVWEEGGVKAKIVKKIGTVDFFYTHPARGRIMKFVTFFLMKYVSDNPAGFDGETSEIAWLPYEEAFRKLSFGREKEVLEKAKQLLDS